MKIGGILAFALCAAFATCFTGCSDSGIRAIPEQPPQQVSIIPGESIGQITLGETCTDIEQAYGSPSAASTLLGYVYAVWETRGIAAGGVDANQNGLFDSTEQCLGIAVTAPFAGSTAEGIHIGSTRAEVLTAFGTPDIASSTNDRFMRKGIAFAYANDSEDIVTQIAIFAPLATV
ncbi:MAG TPA: hypothetical protein VHV83_06220, partial [Armatimonadota bacterium]|nr:hypothetical protein [Armatimonadota bacterium]